MKLNKIILFISILFIFNFSWSQEEAVLPNQLPKILLGTWIDEFENVKLIITENYIINEDELFYYYDINRINNNFNIAITDDLTVKYLNIYINNPTTISCNTENSNRIKYHKLEHKKLTTIPEQLEGNWFNGTSKLEIKGNKVRYLDIIYTIDYFVSKNNRTFYVLYNNGNYFLLSDNDTQNSSFLNTTFTNYPIFKKETSLNKYKTAIIIYSIIIIIIICYFLIRWKIESNKKKEANKRLFVEIQLKGIRSQMNPHFLFNALSAIQYLINKEETEKANHYLTEFSQLMRLTLDKSEKGLVPLQDEITSITKYLELENLRFPFKYEIKTDSIINTNDIEIPAMLIQPFVENAIVHGLKEKIGSKNLLISFSIEQDNLICKIIDDGIGINASQKKKKTSVDRKSYGLKLAKDRIHLINEHYKTDAKVSFIDLSISLAKTGTEVTVSLPLRY